MVVGGLDLGTTGCKIALYNENAEYLDAFYCEYPTRHYDGYSELDFADLKAGIFSVLKQAAAKYEIAALTATSFGEMFAMLDENDNILAPAMLYTDPRGGDECDSLVAHFGKEYLTVKAGIAPHPMYSISKLMWMKNNKPDAFAKCRHVLLGQDFAVYTLCGVAQIDYSLASRTAAFDVSEMKWMEDVFEFCGIDVNLMSKPVPTGTPAGTIRPELKAELGIANDMLVVSGAQDQIAAMIGAGIFGSDTAMEGLGTVDCVPVVLQNKPEDITYYEGGFPAVPYLNGAYACYAFSFTGGATLKWFRDNFAELEREKAKAEGKNVYAELDAAVCKGPTGILILPHFGGAATPYMDNGSKAAMVGITMQTGKTDIYKALMEGTTYEMKMNLEVLEKFTGRIKQLRATGGGSSSDVWLQIKADIFNTEIAALASQEVGAAGAAALAGKAIGIYSDLRETTAKMVPERKKFYPDAENHAEYMKIFEKYKGLYKAVRSLV